MGMKCCDIEANAVCADGSASIALSRFGPLTLPQLAVSPKCRSFYAHLI